jgi:hypothetical protein
MALTHFGLLLVICPAAPPLPAGMVDHKPSFADDHARFRPEAIRVTAGAYDGHMVIRAPLVGSQLMQVSKSKRLPSTGSACPVCLSGPGEFCRRLISEAGAEPIRLGGYLIDVHPERVQEPSRQTGVGLIDASAPDVGLVVHSAVSDTGPTDSNL